MYIKRRLFILILLSLTAYSFFLKNQLIRFCDISWNFAVDGMTLFMCDPIRTAAHFSKSYALENSLPYPAPNMYHDLTT